MVIASNAEWGIYADIQMRMVWPAKLYNDFNKEDIFLWCGGYFISNVFPLFSIVFSVSSNVFTDVEDKLNMEDILFQMSSLFLPLFSLVFPISSNVFTDEKDKLNKEDILFLMFSHFL